MSKKHTEMKQENNKNMDNKLYQTSLIKTLDFNVVMSCKIQ